MEETKTIVRCTLRNSLRADIPTPDDAVREVKEKLLAAQIPVVEVIVIFLGGLTRYAEVTAFIDDQPYHFEILTKAR